MESEGRKAVDRKDLTLEPEDECKKPIEKTIDISSRIKDLEDNED